jgi:hypothetical protein
LDKIEPKTIQISSLFNNIDITQIATDICDVQPMTGPLTGQIFNLCWKYEWDINYLGNLTYRCSDYIIDDIIKICKDSSIKFKRTMDKSSKQKTLITLKTETDNAQFIFYVGSQFKINMEITK